MPYFFILPFFALWLLLWVLASIGLRFTRFRRWAPYGWAVTIGSSLGFILGNALLLPLLTVVAHLPPATQEAKGIGTAIIIFLGPFAASAVGICLGAASSIVLLALLRWRAV